MKILKIAATLIAALSIIGAIAYTQVRVSSKQQKTITLSLTEGMRIIIIDKGADRVYTQVTPKEKRLYDYTVPSGKLLTGNFEEKQK